MASYAPPDVELSAKAAQAHDRFAAEMSPNQIAEARKIAREWQQKQRHEDPTVAPGS